MHFGIDAGHGLGNRTAGTYDPGAVALDSGGNQCCEADITLIYAWVLADELKSLGLGSSLIREHTQHEVKLLSRVSRAVNLGCDAIISIHTNAAESPTASGCEVWYGDEKKDRPLATAILTGIVSTDLGIRNRGLKKNIGLAVLKTTMPAALLEIGFISNSQERLVISNITNVRKICRSIANQIKY